MQIIETGLNVCKSEWDVCESLKINESSLYCPQKWAGPIHISNP